MREEVPPLVLLVLAACEKSVVAIGDTSDDNSNVDVVVAEALHDLDDLGLHVGVSSVLELVDYDRVELVGPPCNSLQHEVKVERALRDRLLDVFRTSLPPTLATLSAPNELLTSASRLRWSAVNSSPNCSSTRKKIETNSSSSEAE